MIWKIMKFNAHYYPNLFSIPIMVTYVALCYNKYDIFAYQSTKFRKSLWNVPKHGAWNKLNFSPKSAHGRFHRKMFGPPRPLQCQVCRATFEKQSALTSHSCYTNFIPTKVRYVNIIIFDQKGVTRLKLLSVLLG